MLTRLSQRDFAKLLDGPAVDREIDRLSRKRGGWLDVAQILSRRINPNTEVKKSIVWR